jgi:hypothetical protein
MLSVADYRSHPVITDDEIEQLFRNSHQLDKKEVRAFIKGWIGLKDDVIMGLFVKFDTNHNEYIDKTEFLSMMRDINDCIQKFDSNEKSFYAENANNNAYHKAFTYGCCLCTLGISVWFGNNCLVQDSADIQHRQDTVNRRVNACIIVNLLENCGEFEDSPKKSERMQHVLKRTNEQPLMETRPMFGGGGIVSVREPVEESSDGEDDGNGEYKENVHDDLDGDHDSLEEGMIDVDLELEDDEEETSVERGNNSLAVDGSNLSRKSTSSY